MSELSYDDLAAVAGRIRRGESDIDAEAVRHSLPDLVATLRRTRDALRARVDEWSQEQLRVRPDEAGSAGGAEDEDRWSATEAVSHLIATQNWYLLNLDRMVGRRQVYDVMPRGLGDHADRDVSKEDLAARLRAATDRIVAYFDAIPPGADLAARRDSIFFGELSIRGWALLAVIHDLDHLAQIERLAHLPGFPS